MLGSYEWYECCQLLFPRSRLNVKYQIWMRGDQWNGNFNLCDLVKKLPTCWRWAFRSWQWHQHIYIFISRTVFCFLVIHSIVNVVHTPFNLVCLTISRWHISADCLIKTVTVIFSSSIWWTNAQNPSTHTQNNNGAGLWVGQMVPSTPSYQRSDENR